MFRNLLLILGALCVLSGAAIGYLWLTAEEPPVEAAKPEPAPAPPPPVAKIAVLSVVHDISSGTLLQQGDVFWKEIEPTEIHEGNVIRGQTPESDFAGALAKRNFTKGEALVANDVLKQGDRRFLAAALKPGTRAVSIPVDATQSAYGLIEPGNFVDVILTQTLSDQPAEARRKVVAETILQDIRVIAVDQATTAQQSKLSIGLPFTEPRLPKTVTLELTRHQAETVFVALQLGRLQLSLRAVEDERGDASGDEKERSSTWGSDVSPALKQLPPQTPSPSASTLESAIRRPPPSGFLQ